MSTLRVLIGGQDLKADESTVTGESDVVFYFILFFCFMYVQQNKINKNR